MYYMVVLAVLLTSLFCFLSGDESSYIYIYMFLMSKEFLCRLYGYMPDGCVHKYELQLYRLESLIILRIYMKDLFSLRFRITFSFRDFFFF